LLLFPTNALKFPWLSTILKLAEGRRAGIRTRCGKKLQLTTEKMNTSPREQTSYRQLAHFTTGKARRQKNIGPGLRKPTEL